MKFPVAFRVFASLNLIGFLVLFIQSAFVFMSPLQGSWLLIVSCFATAWMLLASLFWFFGSRRSYSLLIINALVLWLVAGSVLHWGFIQKAVSTSGDKIFFLLYGCLCFIYSIFLLISLAFKPIKEWTTANQVSWWDTKIGSAFLISLTICAGTSYYLDQVARNFIVLETVQPYQIISETELFVDFNQLTEMDGLVMLCNKEAEEDEVEATIFFADNYNAQSVSEFTSSQKVRFKKFSMNALREGDTLPVYQSNEVYLAANFPAVKARRLLIQTSIPNLITMKETFTSLHSVSLFDRSKTAEEFFTYADEVADEPEEGYDGDYFEPEMELIEIEEPDGAPIELDHSGAVRLYNQFKNDLINRNDWYYFNRTITSIGIDGVEIGHYLNFRSLIEYVPQTLNQFLVDYRNEPAFANYSLNSGVRKLTGVNLFTNYGEAEDKFNYVNPKAVVWVQKNLLLLGGDMIGNVDSREVYQKVFKRMFWQLAASHEYLRQNDEGYFEQEAEAYQQAMQEPGFNGVEYLYNRYKDVHEDSKYFSLVKQNNPKLEDDFYYFDEQVAIGFWLRRKIDGSELPLWELVKEVMKTYDDSTYPQRVESVD